MDKTESSCKCKCYRPGCLGALTIAVAEFGLFALVLFPFAAGACHSDPEGTGLKHDMRTGALTIGAWWYAIGRDVSRWTTECHESEADFWAESSNG